MHKGIITDGPLDAPTVDNAPNPSNLDSITNEDFAQPIDGHKVRLRWPLSEVGSANESSSKD